MWTDEVQSKRNLQKRRAAGERAAQQLPVASMFEWSPPTDRRDPVDLLTEQNVMREPDLVPVRHGRMMASPLAFYRGAARVMADDLGGLPSTGLDVQLCGDAHLSNFGAYASPERRLLFGLNDFDETLPGPFEYDLKRMAVSFTVAARHNGFDLESTRAVTAESVTSYRSTISRLASMRRLEVWYAGIAEDDIREGMTAIEQEIARVTRDKTKRKGGKNHPAGSGPAMTSDVASSIKKADKKLRKAHSRDSVQALGKMAEVADGRYRIVHKPPLVVPFRELEGAWGMSRDKLRDVVEAQFQAYQASLSEDRRHLLASYHIVDAARRVVGVGSVGTRAFMVLLEGRDDQDPLFLQVKEATRSVLEGHYPATRFPTPGQRVVEGQRLMQTASDIFLGWTRGVQDGRFYYWRQLRDMKLSADVENQTPAAMTFYASLCGRTLAHAHARSGDPVAVSAYLSAAGDLEDAVTLFAARYADQNERDHERFVMAVKAGRIPAVEGL